MAVSSLTVARQRGILTRFPVFAERQRRAFRTSSQRAETTVAKNLTAHPVEVKSTVSRKAGAPFLARSLREKWGFSTYSFHRSQALFTKLLTKSLRTNALTFSTSPSHTSQSKAPRSPPPTSPAENKTSCSSPGTQYLPAAVPEADSSAPARSANSRHHQHQPQPDQQLADIRHNPKALSQISSRSDISGTLPIMAIPFSLVSLYPVPTTVVPLTRLQPDPRRPAPCRYSSPPLPACILEVILEVYQRSCCSPSRARSPLHSQDVLTYHNNNTRTGLNNQETTLTLSQRELRNFRQALHRSRRRPG